MSPRTQSLLANISTVVVLVGLVLFFTDRAPLEDTTELAPSATTTLAQTGGSRSQVAAPSDALPIPPLPKKVTASSSTTTKSVTKPATKPSDKASSSTSQKQPNEVNRVQNPYPFAPHPLSLVNINTRQALVNILCMPQGGTLRPISGSGVIIDPRGVILTNAHVAQYVLLSQSPKVDLSCVIRSGDPAIPRWRADTLYIPPVWVEQHVGELNETRTFGTGEHDYALLLITASVNGSPLPAPPAGGFPFLPIDVRDGIGFKGDKVLAAGYAAEFLGGLTAQNNLYAASSEATIGQLLTFGADTVDLISLGGIIEAQSGSSGGPIVNPWGRLIGIITTTSEGTTTADRDLRAITLSYIDRDIATLTNFDLAAIFGGDLLAQADDFRARVAPRLIDLYVEQLKKKLR